VASLSGTQHAGWKISMIEEERQGFLVKARGSARGRRGLLGVIGNSPQKHLKRRESVAIVRLLPDKSGKKDTYE